MEPLTRAFDGTPVAENSGLHQKKARWSVWRLGESKFRTDRPEGSRKSSPYRWPNIRCGHACEAVRSAARRIHPAINRSWSTFDPDHANEWLFVNAHKVGGNDLRARKLHAHRRLPADPQCKGRTTALVFNSCKVPAEAHLMPGNMQPGHGMGSVLRRRPCPFCIQHFLQGGDDCLAQCGRSATEIDLEAAVVEVAQGAHDQFARFQRIGP